MGEASDSQLIAASVVDPAQFAGVFDRHFASIHGYLARRMSRADADELAGEVFRIAFERRTTFDTGRESALPWLYGITTNLVFKHRRRAARALRAMAREAARSDARTDWDAFSIADERMDAHGARGAVIAALRSLTDVDRELVLIAAFGDLSYRELAEATGLSEGTVKSKLSRARAKLRERIDATGEVKAGPQTSRVMGEQT